MTRFPKLARALRGAVCALAVAAPAHALAAGVDVAAPCLYVPPVSAQLSDAELVADYRSILRICQSFDGRARVAIRSMTIGNAPIVLLADPEALTTRLERAACWRCEDTREDALNATRMMRAVAQSSEAPGIAHRGFLENAGLVHGAAEGAFVTGDLCPSPRPLDRPFFERLIAWSPRAPIALSISGLWLTHHWRDFLWLRARQAAGGLDILWVNHSYRHPYAHGATDDQTYLMTRGVDVDFEVMQNERLLIANGQTPSLFFRFPGLVSSAPLMQAVRRHRLIALGADAWLALNQRPGPGSIILVHPNGNEETGLALFDRYRDRGAIARPLESLVAAPN